MTAAFSSAPELVEIASWYNVLLLVIEQSLFMLAIARPRLAARYGVRPAALDAVARNMPQAQMRLLRFQLLTTTAEAWSGVNCGNEQICGHSREAIDKNCRFATPSTFMPDAAAACRTAI
jgi:hypothetical protein